MACFLLSGDTGGTLYVNGPLLVCVVSIFKLLLRVGGRGILDGDGAGAATVTGT